MNFLGFAFPLALLVAVQLTTLTWAATNVTKTSGKGKKVTPLRRISVAYAYCIHWIKRRSCISHPTQQACSSLFNPAWVVNSIPIVDLNVNLSILMFDRQILKYVLLEKNKLWDTLSITCWKQFTVEQKKLWWTLIFMSRKFFPREV